MPLPANFWGEPDKAEREPETASRLPADFWDGPTKTPTMALDAPDEPVFHDATFDISSQSMSTLNAALDKIPSDEAFDRASDEIENIADERMRAKVRKRFDAQRAAANAIRRGAERRTAMEQEYANQRELGLLDRTKKVFLGGGGVRDVRDEAPSTLAGYEQRAAQEAERERYREIGIRMGTAPLRAAMWLFDQPHRFFVRTPSAMLGGGYTFEQARNMPAEEWASKFYDVATRADGGVRSTVARLTGGAPMAAGALVGGLIGIPTAIAGAVADEINGDTPPDGVSFTNAAQTVAGSAKSGAQLGLQLLSDPLNFFSFGGTSGEAAKALKAAGREAELGRYAGQPFLSVHPPFMSGMSRPVGTPFAFRDWFGQTTGQTGQKAIDTLATKVLHAEPIYDEALRTKMRLARGARGAEAILRQEMGDRFKDEIAALPDEFKAKLADPKFRAEWYRRHAEYRDWTRERGVPGQTIETPMGPAVERLPSDRQGDLYSGYAPNPLSTPFTADYGGALGPRPLDPKQMDLFYMQDATRPKVMVEADAPQSALPGIREHAEGEPFRTTTPQINVRREQIQGELFKGWTPDKVDPKWTSDWGATLDPHVDPGLQDDFFRMRATERPEKTVPTSRYETAPPQVAANQRAVKTSSPDLSTGSNISSPKFGKIDTEGDYHVLTAGEDFVPYDKLDEVFGQGAQQFTDIVKRHSNEWKDLLVERGYLTPDQAAANPFSGIYLRRPMSSKYGVFDELAAKTGMGAPSRGYTALEKSRVGAAEGFPGGLSNAELPQYAQVGQPTLLDRALGRAPQIDPFELISGYNRLASRAAAETTFRQQMAEMFGREVAAGDASGKNLGAAVVSVKQPDGSTIERTLDPSAYNLMQQTFAPSSGKLGNLATNAIGTDTMPKRGAVAVAKGIDKARATFKGLALKSPSYHVTNYANDMLWRAMSGEKNALANNARAAELLAGGGSEADRATLRALQESGLPVDATSHRFDLDPSRGLADDLQRSIEPKNYARDAYRAIAPAELGGTARSRGFGEMMEARQKLGHALYWMDRGATPEEAVAKSLGTLIDYQSRDSLERGLSHAAPFAKFMSEAPRRAARFMLAKPGTVMSLDRTLRSFDDNTNFEPRESTMNQGPALRLSGVPRHVLEAWTKALANQYAGRLGPGERDTPAEGVPQGLTPILQPKIDLYDAFTPFRSLDNLGMSMHPDLKAALEVLTNRDLVAQRDFDGASFSVPQGSGLGQLGLPVANKDENPMLARYAPQYFLDRGSMMLLNHWLGMQQPFGPTSTLGAARYFQPDMDRRNVYAQQLMSYLFPFRLQIDDPVSGLANAMGSKTVKTALKNEAEAKARDEDYRRR